MTSLSFRFYSPNNQEPTVIDPTRIVSLLPVGGHTRVVLDRGDEIFVAIRSTDIDTARTLAGHVQDGLDAEKNFALIDESFVAMEMAISPSMLPFHVERENGGIVFTFRENT